MNTDPDNTPSSRNNTVGALILCGTLVSCVAPSPAPPPSAGRLIGGDHDEHGCIAPAGYRWCSREKACVRPWELAAKVGLQSDEAAFGLYCEGTPNQP